MLPVLYFAIGAAILHFVLRLAFHTALRWQTLQKFSQAHACEPASCDTSWDIFGLYKVATMVRHLIRRTSLPYLNNLFEAYGNTYSTCLLGHRVFFTCHPANIRDILITKFADYDSSQGIRHHLFRPVTPKGILALDGEEWRAARAQYRDIFSHTRRILDFELQETCFANLHKQITSDQKTDLQPLFIRLTVDLTTAFAFGESINCLGGDQTLAEREFVDALLYMKSIIARDGYLGPLHIFRGKKKFHASCGVVHRFVDDKIHRQLEAKRVGKISGERGAPCILTTLTEESDNVPDIRDGITTILIAGTSSVATLLSNIFFLLARHERVLQQLRSSIIDVAGYDPPSYDMLRSMTYLRHVINETMRVYPPVPFNARRANKDTVLSVGGGPNGESSVLVKEGQRVVFASWASHRSFEYFGDDAHVFRPERWSSLKAETLGYIPFHLGPRGCPGQHFAVAETSYTTVRLLQTFSSVKSRDDRAWTEQLGLSLSNRNGTIVELSRST